MGRGARTPSATRHRPRPRRPQWYGWLPDLPDHRDLIYAAPLRPGVPLPRRIDPSAVNTSFTSALDSAQRSYASSLLGKEVSFTTADDSGTSTTSTGIVSQVSDNTNGEVQLTVGSQTVALADVLSVQNASSSTTSH